MLYIHTCLVFCILWYVSQNSTHKHITDMHTHFCQHRYILNHTHIRTHILSLSLSPSLHTHAHAHTHTHTHFLQCFSSIVGPNGSGKSNVIDSMLFVFGYRARKIRSKKVAVLIHNSEHHQNLQSCTVSVHFQKIIDLVRKLDQFFP